MRHYLWEGFLLLIAGAILAVLIGPTVYLFPFLLAAYRRKRNTSSIFVLNLLTGWTIVGWVVALIWAVAYESTPLEERTIIITRRRIIGVAIPVIGIAYLIWRLRQED